MKAARDGALNARDVIRLYGTFNRRLRQIVRGSVLAHEAVVEDACQVAWTALISQTFVDRASAEPWLVRTALREALRLMRLEDREDSLDSELAQPALQLRPASAAGPEELISDRERIRGVRLLTVRQQRLVWLRALGFSHQEIASYENCTDRTVRRQLDQAWTRLRALDGGAEAYRVAA